MIKRFIDFVDSIKNMNELRRPFYIILVLVVLSDFFVHREHVAFFWDHIPGWSALYGFISCIVIILVSKFIGHEWLLKEEDYYD
ncbi:MAG: hypothetical protein AABZ11_07695 [Nitrospinota bacterium]|jgi:hypothetical protein